MVLSSLTFGGGLASSLHCAGTCGPIATSLTFGFGPSQRRTLIAQAGRILVYVAARGAGRSGRRGDLHGVPPSGGVSNGARGGGAVARLDWIFAAGPRRVARRPRSPRRPRRARGGGAARGARAARSPPAWSGDCCLAASSIYAALSGGPVNSAAVMAGFGLGTLPAVTAVAFGLSRFRALAHAPRARAAVGLGLMGIAAASLVAPAPGLAVFCLP